MQRVYKCMRVCVYMKHVCNRSTDAVVNVVVVAVIAVALPWFIFKSMH